jgi:hypothetical protein
MKKHFARMVRLDRVLVFALFWGPDDDGGGDRRTCCDGDRWTCCDGGLGVCAGWRGKMFYTRGSSSHSGWQRGREATSVATLAKQAQATFASCWVGLAPDHALVASRPAPAAEQGSGARQERQRLTLNAMSARRRRGRSDGGESVVAGLSQSGWWQWLWRLGMIKVVWLTIPWVMVFCWLVLGFLVSSLSWPLPLRSPSFLL